MKVLPLNFPLKAGVRRLKIIFGLNFKIGIHEHVIETNLADRDALDVASSRTIGVRKECHARHVVRVLLKVFVQLVYVLFFVQALFRHVGPFVEKDILA